MVSNFPDTEGITGSSPVSPTLKPQVREGAAPPARSRSHGGSQTGSHRLRRVTGVRGRLEPSAGVRWGSATQPHEQLLTERPALIRADGRLHAAAGAQPRPRTGRAGDQDGVGGLSTAAPSASGASRRASAIAPVWLWSVSSWCRSQASPARLAWLSPDRSWIACIQQLGRSRYEDRPTVS